LNLLRLAQLLFQSSLLGHVAAVEDDAADGWVVEQVIAAPFQHPVAAVAVAEPEAQDWRVTLVLKSIEKRLHDPRGVLRVDEFERVFPSVVRFTPAQDGLDGAALKSD